MAKWWPFYVCVLALILMLLWLSLPEAADTRVPIMLGGSSSHV
jgi:hypothetical protein